MKTSLVIVYGILWLLFTGFLAYTFFAKSHLEHLAREYVTEKTIEHSEKPIKLAEQALGNPLAKKLLKKEQIEFIENEIAQYHQDKKAYIKELTGMKKPDIPQQLNPLIQKSLEFKNDIRTFYDNTLQALINDIRIFSGTNTLAALIGLILCIMSKEKIHQSIIWFAVILLIVLSYNIYFYIDHLSFFKILLRSHMGWWYPLSIIIGVCWCCVKDRYHKNKNDSLYKTIVGE